MFAWEVLEVFVDHRQRASKGVLEDDGNIIRRSPLQLGQHISTQRQLFRSIHMHKIKQFDISLKSIKKKFWLVVALVVCKTDHLLVSGCHVASPVIGCHWLQQARQVVLRDGLCVRLGTVLDKGLDQLKRFLLDCHHGLDLAGVDHLWPFLLNLG